MPRFIRNTAILAKIETTPGTDAAPTGALNAILVSNVTINPLNAQNVARDLVRPFFGGSEQLSGTGYLELSFDVELVGGGTAGNAPAWGALLRACAMAETLTATTRVDYTPVTNSLESASIYYYDDGLLHKLLYARGSATFVYQIGEKSMIKFRFLGLYSPPTAAANPSVTLTGFRTPEVVTDANTADVTLGATHSPSGAPALTGGTVYVSRGLQVELGNALNYTPLLGAESIDITDRDVTGETQLDLSAAQEVALMAAVRANTLQSVGLLHGTVAGTRSLLFSPAVQLTEPSKEEINGRRLIGFKTRHVPVSGNDELRLVTCF